jgi:hypothetical protein
LIASTVARTTAAGSSINHTVVINFWNWGLLDALPSGTRDNRLNSRERRRSFARLGTTPKLRFEADVRFVGG